LTAIGEKFVGLWRKTEFKLGPNGTRYICLSLRKHSERSRCNSLLYTWRGRSRAGANPQPSPDPPDTTWPVNDPKWAILRGFSAKNGLRQPFPAKPETEIWRTPRQWTRNYRLFIRLCIHCGVYLDAKWHFVFGTLTIGPLWRRSDLAYFNGTFELRFLALNILFFNRSDSNLIHL